MAYKPKVIKNEFARGPSGVASVALNGNKTKAKITFKDNEKSIIVSDFPKELMAGVWFVSLSENEKKVISVRPANGVYTGKVQKFAAAEGEQPSVRTRIGADWNYQFFVVLLEITRGTAKGMSVPVMPRYHFGEAEEECKSVVAFSHPRSKYTPLLVEFCDVTGVWERGPMPYKDNILPMMEKRILREATEFQFVMKNGYVDSFLELDMPVEEEMSEDDDQDFPEEETLPDDEG